VIQTKYVVSLTNGRGIILEAESKEAAETKAKVVCKMDELFAHAQTVTEPVDEEDDS